MKIFNVCAQTEKIGLIRFEVGFKIEAYPPVTFPFYSETIFNLGHNPVISEQGCLLNLGSRETPQNLWRGFIRRTTCGRYFVSAGKNQQNCAEQ
ncbi:hypothetical protein B1H10_09005 [candidate division KSB1 bacterium 4484_188]|nr:MAG: hypothetical protein B1H10_09005 [candidate division KSB1 bacterium 4484_188]